MWLSKWDNDDELLIRAYHTLNVTHYDREQKSVPPMLKDGRIEHPNLNADGTWREAKPAKGKQ